MCCLFVSSFDLFLDLHCHFSSLNCGNNLRASPMIYPEYTTLFISFLPSRRLDLRPCQAKEVLYHWATTLSLFLVSSLTTPPHFLSSALKSSQFSYLTRTYFTLDFSSPFTSVKYAWKFFRASSVSYSCYVLCAWHCRWSRDPVCSAHPFSDSVSFT